MLNAELPLIRVAERNAFRQAIIAYEQQRRALQSQEDFIKNQLRGDIRSMQVTYIQYEITKRNLVLNIRLKDQAFEQIVAPPQSGAQGLAQSANAATQTIEPDQLPEHAVHERGRPDPSLRKLPSSPFDRVSRHWHLALR